MFTFIWNLIRSFLLRIFEDEEFKKRLWDLLIRLIEIVRDEREKTKTGL